MRCDGCGSESHECTFGYIAPHNTTATRDNIQSVAYCPECWEIVDNCDPVTGSYGAAACDVRRALPEEVKAHYATESSTTTA
jgi:hypothetical protein